MKKVFNLFFKYVYIYIYIEVIFYWNDIDDWRCILIFYWENEKAEMNGQKEKEC